MALTLVWMKSIERFLASAVALSLLPGMLLGHAPGPSIDPSQRTYKRSVFRFSDCPVSDLFTGPVAKPTFNRKSDRQLRKVIQGGVKEGPNFAGHYVLVKFKIGEGPTGAVVVDAKSGSVFRLPSKVVREGFFVYDTECLALYNKWRSSAADEDDDGSPLSFQPGSELLIVRRCKCPGNVVIVMEKSYFRWHRNRWTLLKSVTLPPAPPLPVE